MEQYKAIYYSKYHNFGWTNPTDFPRLLTATIGDWSDKIFGAIRCPMSVDMDKATS